MHNDLRQRWDAFWRDANITPQKAHDDAFNDIIAGYGGDGRPYHNLDHLRDVLQKLDWAKEALVKTGELSGLNDHETTTMFRAIEIALWYHDVVYDATRKDNEEQSRELFLKHAGHLGLDETTTALAAHLIDITAHHKDAKTLAERIMTDCDLAVLGASAAAFKIYDDNIRREYSHYDDDIYAVGRAQALGGFLKQEKIFKTDAFHQVYEEAAKNNLCQRLGLSCKTGSATKPNPPKAV